ncbi:plakophilin-3-like isoform X1 [Oncorhynchus kisutch]|uniref:Plakophilin 3 n=2 Tax=Oncorhynchus kisutch TaxID=8019 RepID=A0A8C7I2N6_ONCKI|nr:plakophilin-3-like isoform X1 [Oncorhynchus kisutch]
MSATVASESCFLSALQPITAVTTYAVPSDVQLGPRCSIMDEVERAKRVQQQVNLRLAEKKYSTLTRLNGSNCISPDHGGTMRFNTYHPGFRSKSMVYNTGSWTMKMSPVSKQYLGGGYSSRSAVELGPRYRISQPPVNIGYLHHDDIQLGGYQTSRTRTARSRSVCQADQEVMVQGVGGLLTLPHQQPNPVTMRRTLSGTLAGDGSGGWREAELVYQPSYRGPAHRTISRINNRQQQQQQLSSASGLQQWQQVSGGGSGSVYGGWGQYQNSLPRLASFHSIKSVEKGMDVPDGGSDSADSNQKLRGMHSLDIPTAVNYLFMSDTDMQVLGAAYIQHQCYHSSDAKNQVRLLKGVPALVQLFSSDSQKVQCYATGATHNLIYENMDNKAALIEAEGITKLISVLNEPDEELRKNITGILFNMSSKESLKEKLARETLSELTERVLVPLCSGGDSELIRQSPSEADIFYNTSGCLRNLSSVNERTRQQMRDTRGLVDSLVAYIQNSLQDEKSEDKGVENAVCVLRNLSYQLYSEIPPSTLLRLEGPTWARDTTGTESIGCFTPQSKKAKERWNQELSTSEVAKQPKGAEWLWHPQLVGLYNRVLQHYEANTATREAAAGALQNITARETRWASVLSWVALEQERMLPVVLDLLQTQSDQEMCSLTGLLRNLSRHRNKNDMTTKVVNVLVTKLPSDGHQKEPSGEVVVNICGILNNLVAGSSLAARDITFFDGLPKLVAIKSSHNSSSGKRKAAKAASTVLFNMFQYNKLHKDYKQKGFTKCDFTDTAI